MRTHNAESQLTMTPKKALTFLLEGNERFQQNLKANRNLLQQVNETSEGQWPFAAVLSCIDSRTSAELIFDQGLGDIFSVRIAGNFVNDDILGSLEYACEVAGSKLIVVLGHTRCGAVNAACSGPGEGYIGRLLEKIHPAVELAKAEGDTSSSAESFANLVASKNVELAVQQIRNSSTTLSRMERSGQIGIIGGIYHVTHGEVELLENTASEGLREAETDRCT